MFIKRRRNLWMKVNWKLLNLCAAQHKVKGPSESECRRVTSCVRASARSHFSADRSRKSPLSALEGAHLECFRDETHLVPLTALLPPEEEEDVCCRSCLMYVEESNLHGDEFIIALIRPIVN